MVSRRRGASSLGCLFMLLVLSAVAYFGVNVGEVYWRFYRYQDDFRQEARFAGRTKDEVILARLHALADSLDLPPDAHEIELKRGTSRITIRAEYTERVELPLNVREIRFTPHAEAPL